MWVDNIWSTSDHLPITVELFPLTPQPSQQSIRTVNNKAPRWSPINKDIYVQEMLNSPFAVTDHTSMSPVQLNDLLISGITTAAFNCNMINTHKSGKLQSTKPWFDADCRTLKAEVSALLKICKSYPSERTHWESYHRAKSLYYATLDKKKSEYAALLQEKFANTRNSSEFWSVIRSTRKQSTYQTQISMDDWEKFFENIYPPKMKFHGQLLINSNDHLDADITMDELLLSIAKAKVKKAAGSDGVTNEFIKVLPHNWLTHILTLFNKIFETGFVPENWSEVTMCMLHKKGDPTDPGNYRGIALVNCITKIFTQIIHDRIKKWAETEDLIPEEQAGFRNGRGCEDNVFVLQSVLQIQARFKGVSSYALFVDFKRAFDSVPHNRLWEKLNQLGLSSKILNLLVNFYSNTHMRVRCSGNLSSPINITEGVLQGEILSPLLFSLYISDIVKYLKQKGAEGLFIDSCEITLLMYADDIVLVASTEVKLRRILKILEEYCKINGLTVNTTKTKILIIRSTGRLPRQLANFPFLGEALDIVSTYEYLGTTFCTSLQGTIATESAIKKSKMATSTVLGILNKLNTSAWNGVIKLHSSIIRSSIAYLAHIWSLSQSTLERLESANLYFFKRLMNLPLSTPHYAIRLELGLNHFSLYVLKAALNWVIKILDMPSNRLPKICLKKLVQLTHTPFNSDRLNWCQQLSNILINIGEEDLLSNLTADYWRSRKLAVLEKYKDYRHSRDMERYYLSKSCLFYFNNASLSHTSAEFILSQLPDHLAKLLCQCRLSTTFACHISVGKLHIKLSPTKNCPCCYLEKPDNILHLISDCPAYQIPREKFLSQWYNHEIPRGIDPVFLESWSTDSTKKLFAFCKACYFIRNHLEGTD